MYTVSPFVGNCQMCKKTFKSAQFAATHSPCTASVSGRYQCPECGELFETIQSLASHRLKKHLPGRYSCNLCPKSCITQNQIERHVQRIHLGLKKYVCAVPGCMQSFSRSNQLDQHVTQVHAPGSSLLHPVPELIAATQAAETAVPSDPSHPVPVPETTTDTSDLQLLLSLMQHCETCDGYFLSERGLKNHLKRHKVQAEVPCKTEETITRTSTPESTCANDASNSPDPGPAVECEESSEKANDEEEDMQPKTVPAPEALADAANCTAESQETLFDVRAAGEDTEKTEEKMADEEMIEAESETSRCTSVPHESLAEVVSTPELPAFGPPEPDDGESKCETGESILKALETLQHLCSTASLNHDDDDELWDDSPAVMEAIMEAGSQTMTQHPPPVEHEITNCPRGQNHETKVPDPEFEPMEEDDSQEEDLDVSITEEIGVPGPKLLPQPEVITIDDDDDDF